MGWKRPPPWGHVYSRGGRRKILPATRQLLIAYALAHMAQVDLASSDPEEAAEKIRRALEMWQADDGSDGLDGALFEALL